MNAHTFHAHRTQLCNVPGCDCSCPNCRVPPLPESRLAEYLTSGAVLLFVIVAIGLALWAMS